jgi:hypothetical protein
MEPRRELANGRRRADVHEDDIRLLRSCFRDPLVAIGGDLNHAQAGFIESRVAWWTLRYGPRNA